MVRAKVRDTELRMAFWYARSADGLEVGVCLGALTLELCQTSVFSWGAPNGYFLLTAKSDMAI